MALARSRRERGIDYWPGFVDALSTLLLGIIFLLSVFVVAQFFLSQEVTGKDTALQRLNAQIAAAHRAAVAGKDRQGQPRGHARARCARTSRPPRASATGCKGLLKAACSSGSGAGRDRRARRPARRAEAASRRARWRRSSCSTSRSRRCAASSPRSKRRSTPPRARTRKSQAQIADLGQRLNLALAQRVQELSRYRSDFFGTAARRSSATGRTSASSATASCSSRKCSSTPAGGAIRPEGRAELDKLATALAELEKQIPTDIAWVLRVDGHTDVRPITSAAVPVELGAVGGARHLGRAVSDRQGHLAAAPGRRRLRRIPAARRRRDRGSLSPQPPHRAEADRAVTEPRMSAAAVRLRRIDPADAARNVDLVALQSWSKAAIRRSISTRRRRMVGERWRSWRPTEPRSSCAERPPDGRRSASSRDRRTAISTRSRSRSNGASGQSPRTG